MLNKSHQPHIRASLVLFECNKKKRPAFGKYFIEWKHRTVQVPPISLRNWFSEFGYLSFIYDCLNSWYSRYLGLANNWSSTSKLVNIIHRWQYHEFMNRNWYKCHCRRNSLTSHNGDTLYVFSLSNGRRDARLSRLSADFFAWLCVRSFFISFSNPSNISANLSFPTACDDRRILLTYFRPCTSSLKKKRLKVDYT